jgi:uncharacterized repeat protein (TIGR03803 family)
MSRNTQTDHEPRASSSAVSRLGRIVLSGSRIGRMRWQAALVLLASGIGMMPGLMSSGLAQAPEPEQLTGSTYTVLHSFAGGTKDGANPFAGLVLDSAGNLYGTTQHGGASGNCGSAGCGTIFKLTPARKFTLLHSFTGQPADGAIPGARLITDPAGNFYGTTEAGGASGNGTVFKLSPTGVETVLHSFAGWPTDGTDPEASLILDLAGNLYGTTRFGGTTNTCGTGGCGTIFKVAPDGTETVLYSFPGPPEGKEPLAGLILDSAGNLYGTTSAGGTLENGNVFMLAPNGTETVLHSFAGHPTDGYFPRGNLIQDSAGNFYGTTGGGGASNNCGADGCGTVYKLTSAGIESVRHSFAGPPKDGIAPYAGLLQNPAGNLYGTTDGGGTSKNCGSVGCGTIFKLTPTGTEIVLHNFAGHPTDGSFPRSALIRDASGNLYGTTYSGGASNLGVVFKLTGQ